MYVRRISSIPPWSASEGSAMCPWCPMRFFPEPATFANVFDWLSHLGITLGAFLGKA